MSGRTSETLHRRSWYSVEGYSLDLQTSPQILGLVSWNQISGPRTSAKDFWTSLQVQAQILNRISRSSAESFRCAAGHLKCRYQIWYSNLPMYIDNINFLLPTQFKDQIWWNPHLDVWSYEHQPRIWGLVYKFMLKLSVGYQDPRPNVSDLQLGIWISDIRENIIISHGSFP